MADKEGEQQGLFLFVRANKSLCSMQLEPNGDLTARRVANDMHAHAHTWKYLRSEASSHWTQQSSLQQVGWKGGEQQSQGKWDIVQWNAKDAGQDWSQSSK